MILRVPWQIHNMDFDLIVVHDMIDYMVHDIVYDMAHDPNMVHDMFHDMVHGTLDNSHPA